MFAMVVEKDPLRWQDVPGGLVFWIQSAGGWAAFGLALWLLLGYSRMREVDRARIPPWQKSVVFVGAIVALLGYLPVFALWGFAFLAWLFADRTADLSPGLQLFQSICLTAGGAGALLAVGLPFAVNFPTLRPRRIWALTKLSLKQAIRSRVLYAFSALLLVFLFASWFIPHKPEDQVRNYVWVISYTMMVLLLLAALVLASFSIPTDIRQQTIHTIITKPVERFEILAGRFLGFTALMTVVLFLMTTVSVAYVLRGIDPEAAAESLKAREPLYGDLHYENTSDPRKGTNVGREWEYRGHITAVPPDRKPEYAVWDFPTVPRSLGGRKVVRCEFTFDVYRTTKGKENQGVTCEFEFQTARFDKSKKDEFFETRSKRMRQPNRPSDADIDDKLAEDYGYFVVAAKEITDYHTLHIDVPAGLFRNAVQNQPAQTSSPTGESIPPLQVRVRCRSQTQYVGMAKHDLYWRLDDPHGGGEKAAFTWNFYKGAVGLWFRLCLVIGLAVALSTYLSGVISMIVAFLLYVGGMVIDFIQSIGLGTAPGGGPIEALVRMANRQVGIVPLEESTASKVATTSDVAFRWFIRRVLDIIPNVDRYDLTRYVADGFHISITQLLLDFGVLSLYLLPWVVLGYYLIKWREIAAPT